MQAPKIMFRSQKTQFLYDILNSFQQPSHAQQRLQKKEEGEGRQKAKKKQSIGIQQLQSRVGRLKFIEINNWTIESQSKSPKHSSKNKYYPQTTRNNANNSYFKSNNFTPRNQNNTVATDNDHIFDELNKTSVTYRRKINDQSMTKSRLFTKSKLQSIKKTIQFVPIQSKSKPLVFFNKNIVILSKLLKERYWLDVTSELQKANFLWVNQKDFILFQRLRIQQIKKQKQIQRLYLINHLSFDTEKLLQELSSKGSQYAPLTMGLGNNYKELKKVINIVYKQERVKYWIIKPSKKANFTNSHICKTQLVKQFLQSQLKTRKHDSSQLIQQYIHDPFLYNKRKFTIKTYLLVTNINKVTKAYLYNNFIIQTSGLEYKVESRNLCIHFTGNEIQRQSKYYGKYEGNNRVSQQDFNLYLEDVGRENDQLKIQYREHIRYASIQIVRSIASNTNNYYDHLNYQQLFELNFIMQSNYRPLLVGIKNEPNLNVKYLQKQNQKLLQNVLKYSVDVLYPPPLSYLTGYHPQIQELQLIADSRLQGQIQRLPTNIK